MTAKSLPSEITSYDLLKTFAVIIMIIDHVGSYFFPEDLWWRAIGRIGFPVWFFLVGYAQGRDLPARLLIGAGVLILLSVLIGEEFFPMNALVTIALIRIMIDPVMRVTLYSREAMVVISMILILLVIPSYLMVEYGTLALITAMFGYSVRHKNSLPDPSLVYYFMIFALVSFVTFQQILFGFDFWQFSFMALGTLLVRTYLCFFDSLSYPTLTRKLPSFLVWTIQFGGRRTLEIYVVHLILFKCLAAWLEIEGFSFVDFPL